MIRLRLGSRASPLAKAQALGAASDLKQRCPELDIELVWITTRGDQSAERPLDANVKSLFTKEIEEALLSARIDAAVHSLKDMEAHLPPELCLAAVPAREDARDVWISRHGLSWRDSPSGATVGTGSERRRLQLQALRPDLQVQPMRGNIDTRLRHLREGRFDAVVLAAAGLRRLGMADYIQEFFTVQEIVPAVGQGCLAIEARRDSRFLPYIGKLDHEPSRRAAEAERAFLVEKGGSCRSAIAAHASGGQLHTWTPEEGRRVRSV